MDQTYAQWLAALDDADLAAIIALRPDTALPSPPSFDLLASRLLGRSSILRAAERLSTVEVEVIELLALSPQLTAIQVAKRTGSLAHRSAAEALLHTGLVVDSPDLCLPPEVEHVLAERPFGLGRPSEELRHRVASLWSRPIPATPARPDLTDDQRELLEHLDSGGGIGSVSHALHPDGAVGELVDQGLLIPIDESHVQIPREVGIALREEPWGGPYGGLHPGPPPVVSTRVGIPAADRAGGAQALESVRLVEALLEEWSAQPPSELRSGGVGVRDVRALGKTLRVDENTGALLVEVAHAAGLLGRSSRLDAMWLPSTDYDSWQAQGPAHRWVRLAQAWLEMPRLVGLIGSRDDKDKTIAPLSDEVARSWMPQMRIDVLSVLRDAGPGQAGDPEWFAAALRWRAPRRTPLHTATLPGWLLAEAATLGLTGRGALTSAAARLLEGDPVAAQTAVDKVLPKPIDHVVLQPDHTAVVPGPPEPALARELSLLTDSESAGAAAVVRITEASLRRALDVGWSAADVHAWMARVSSTPVPQTLTYLVDDVARRHGRLRVGVAQSYVRCDDDATVAEVLGSKRTRDLGLRRLAAGVLISTQPLDVVLTGLRQAGFAPVAERADGTVAIAAAERPRSTLRPRRVPAPDWGPDNALKVVRALRESQRFVPAADSPTVASRITEQLTAAVRAKREVLLGYVDHAGRLTQRLVMPVEVGAGLLRAHDLRTDMTRTFPLSRINEVASTSD